MRTLLGVGLLFLIVTSGRLSWGEDASIPITPDFGAMQKVVVEQVDKARHAFSSGLGESITGINIRQFSREKDLLPWGRTRPRTSVYLLQVQETAEPAKSGLWYIMVLKPEGKSFVPLLVYLGGFDCSVTGRTVDLGSCVHVKEGSQAVGYPYRDLLIEDTASPNSTSMNRLLLFHYDEKLGYFINIFDEYLTYWHRFEQPYDRFESTFEVPDENVGGMRRLVITTDWWLTEWEPAYSGGTKAIEERNAAIQAGDLKRIMTFVTWDGKRYSKGLDFPKGATPMRPDRKWWLPEMMPSPEASDAAPGE